jgi:hypothetical protein
MVSDERIAAALGAAPQTCKGHVEPALRVLTHDVNGALSAIMMEGFAIEKPASILLPAVSERSSPVHRARRSDLQDSLGNLQRASDDLAGYLVRVEGLVESGRRASAEPP